jgi:hypothetical protein
VVSVLATFLGVWLMGHFGRRRMLMTGLSGIVVVLVVLGLTMVMLPMAQLPCAGPDRLIPYLPPGFRFADLLAADVGTVPDAHAWVGHGFGGVGAVAIQRCRCGSGGRIEPVAGKPRTDTEARCRSPRVEVRWL